jgi:hypothetical protein
MSAFGVMLATLFSDPNLGMDVVYCPQSGSPIPCRAAYAQPDTELTLQPASKLRDTKRILLVQSYDVASPAKDDTVQIPPGGAVFRVMDFRATDPMRLTWRLEVAPQ